MSGVKAFRLPDPGEGLVEAEIISWRVRPGDAVKVNDIVVEIETAKSLVELPVPWAGTVAELLVPEGETVAVGTPIISVDTGAEPGSDDGPGMPSGSASQPAATEARGGDATPSAGPDKDVPHADAPDAKAPGGRVAVLVGYGPRTTEARRRPRKQPGVAAPPAGPVLAKPPVRKFAKDHGVDLADVTPSDGQVVSRADVESFLSGTTSTGGEPGGEPVGEPSREREVRIPVKGVRKATAQAMVRSAFTAPHVTEFVTVDVTRTMKLVDRLREDREFAGVRVSPLLVAAKALLIACARNPGVNASWDEDAQEIVQKAYVNLGIAAATPRGLVVPNIKDADQMDLRGLAGALAELTTTAREGRTQPAELAGGTITITNVGVFGIDTGTPILPPGESAILCFGAVRQRPWVVGGRLRVRWVTELALSFDHRLIDGDLGSRFLADIAAVLERPSQALVWG